MSLGNYFFFGFVLGVIFALVVVYCAANSAYNNSATKKHCPSTSWATSFEAMANWDACLEGRMTLEDYRTSSPRTITKCLVCRWETDGTDLRHFPGETHVPRKGEHGHPDYVCDP